jgi:hypothetical protein
LSAFLTVVLSTVRVSAQCVDHSKDPAGCQPSPFSTPLEQMPTGRVNRMGEPDAKASEADVRAGVALLEKKLHLFRNFEHVHWVPLVPSVRNPQTGEWSGGDLDGQGSARGFGMAGNCIFVGHNTGAGLVRSMTVLKVQANPEQQPPLIVGEIPVPKDIDTTRGVDDKEIRALLYEVAPGQDRMILVRLIEDLIEMYRIDPNTCLPLARSVLYDGPGQPHEFYLWQDATNRKRVLIYAAMSGAGLPDPAGPGLTLPGIMAWAATDEQTGEILPKGREVASFGLHDVGGPPVREKPDATGLFSDGRFADFSHLKDSEGNPGDFARQQNNTVHSLTVSDDGERVYVAGSTAGFYIVNSEGVASSTNAALWEGRCNRRSTVVISSDGVIDGAKLAHIANDCLHTVVSDDPGLKAFLASGASPAAKAQRYSVLLTRARFDPFPPVSNSTGIHSAAFVPNRPAQVRDNVKNRPAYVFLTTENLRACPSSYARIMAVDVETTPVMVGAYTVPRADVTECLELPRPLPFIHSHNPTVFKNLVFVAWYGHGLRAIDISIPQMPREVGHAVTVPNVQNRGYPVLKDGLFYWPDIRSGLHVARYTGPRADELPKSGAGVYDGNSTSPHR